MPYDKKPITNEEIQQFIKKRVRINEERGGCWEWTKSIASNGYGRLERTTRATRHCNTRAVHRASYIVFESDISPDCEIRHRCNNKLCCNPAHLEQGSKAQNENDKNEPLPKRSTAALFALRDALLSKAEKINNELNEVNTELTKRNPPC